MISLVMRLIRESNTASCVHAAATVRGQQQTAGLSGMYAEACLVACFDHARHLELEDPLSTPIAKISVPPQNNQAVHCRNTRPTRP